MPTRWVEGVKTLSDIRDSNDMAKNQGENPAINIQFWVLESTNKMTASQRSNLYLLVICYSSTVASDYSRIRRYVIINEPHGDQCEKIEPEVDMT